MPATRKKETKDGTVYYEIAVSRGRGKSRPTMNWYPPANWGQKAIDRELAKVAAEFERKVKKGEIVSKKEEQDQAKQEAFEASKVKSLKEYCEEIYMPEIKVKRSENTRANYQSYLNNWIYPALGDFKIPEITITQIESLFTTMQEAKKSHATVVKVYTILRGVFKKNYKGKKAFENPMLFVERPTPCKGEEKKKKPEAYTAKELLYIHQCLEKEPLQWRALVYFLSDSGTRRGECCGLQWDNLNFQMNTATICGSLGYTPEMGVFYDSTKNDTVWTIDVDPFVMDLLWRLKIEQIKNGIISPYVFTQAGSDKPIILRAPHAT